MVAVGVLSGSSLVELLPPWEVVLVLGVAYTDKCGPRFEKLELVLSLSLAVCQSHVTWMRPVQLEL